MKRAVLVLAMGLPLVAFAVDFDGVQPAALDQPRVNVWLLPAGSDVPYTYATIDPVTLNNVTGFHVDDAYYDTGASGVLLSEGTASALGISNQAYLGKSVIYEDVGVAGSDTFHTSISLDVAVAPYHPTVATQINAFENAFTLSNDTVALRNNLATIPTQRFNSIHTQVGPIGGSNPLLGDLDVFGIPLMQGKVVVMDPKPVNAAVTATDPTTVLDATMRTYVYNPGTPVKPATLDSDPGIPQTDLHVKLTYASFDRFSKTYLKDETTQATTPMTPSEIATYGPTLAGNPFIGPNPIHAVDASVPAGNAPPVTITLGAQQASGSFLLDTGASASMISSSMAARLGVHYLAGTEGTDNPVLIDAGGNVLANQFLLPIGGIGGTKMTAGFFLTSLFVPTMEGNASNPNDPNNLRYLNAPVLVNDITVVDPSTYNPLTDTYGTTLTLDGIFGMNFLVGSANYDFSGFFPTVTGMTEGPYNWVVFDQPNGILGLSVVPEPTSLCVLFLGATALLRRPRQLRASRC
jgi:hypothetical protein